MGRRPLRGFCAGAAFFLLLCAPVCNRAERRPAGSAEKVALAAATPPFTVLMDVALAGDYFREEGLVVTPRFHSTGKAALEEVLAGTADFATVAETPAMFAIMNGRQIAIVATIQASNRMCVIFARRDRGIQTPRDLTGKRIGATLGSIGEYFLDAFLAANGLSRGDVTVKNLVPEAMPGALAGGEVDAISTWPAVVSLAQRGLGNAGNTFLNEEIYTESFTIVATQEAIRTHPARVERLLRALIRAEQFVRQAPADAQRIVADYRQVDRAELAAEWPNNSFDVGLDQSLLLALEDESRWAVRSGLITGAKIPNYLEYVHLDALRSVKPNAVRILK